MLIFNQPPVENRLNLKLDEWQISGQVIFFLKTLCNGDNWIIFFFFAPRLKKDCYKINLDSNERSETEITR